MGECSKLCLSDPTCFSYISTPETGCQLLPSRGKPKNGHDSQLSAGQLRFRDGMARLNDYCKGDSECTFTVEGSRCHNQECVCKTNLHSFEGKCLTADQLPSTTTAAGTEETSTAGGEGAGANSTTTEGAASTGEPTATGTSSSVTTEQPASETTSQAPSETTSQAPSETTSQAPSETTSQAPSETTSQAPSETTTQAPSETTSQTTSQTTIRTTPAAPAPGGSGQHVSLTSGGPKDTNNDWASACPEGQVVTGAMMRSDGRDQFDNPSKMYCRDFRGIVGSTVNLLAGGQKTIVDLSSDGNTKNCPSTAVVTALYAPGSSGDPFRLGALLCVDVGRDLTGDCGEEDPQQDQPTPGPDNACSENAVVVGAKIKQNFMGWIEKFNCCNVPPGLFVIS